MDSDPKLLERARALDRQGDTDEAVELLTNAGSLEEAARILAGRARYLDAAKLLVSGLGEITTGGRLVPRGHSLARLAAAYFQKAGEVQRAADLLVGVGERAKAIELLERAGKADAALELRKTLAAEARTSSVAPGAKTSPSAPPSAPGDAGGATATGSAAQAQHLEQKGDLEGAMKIYFGMKRFADAGRLARKLGRNNDAGNFYFAAQMFFEAASCYFAAGDRARSLESLARVPKDHPQYRAAAVGAARLAHETGAMGFRVESFLFPFTASIPADASEVEAFYLLGRLYEKNDLPAPAMDLYRKVLAHTPGFRDTQARLAALDIVGEREALARIMDEEAAFRGRPTRKAEEPAPKPGAAPAKKGFPFKKSGPASGARASAPPSPAAPAPIATTQQTLDSSSATPNPVSAAAAERAADAGVNLGSIVAGRYRIDAPLGAGGMAVVFRATDLDIEEAVALKIFTDLAEERSVSRIKHELRISRQLTHPNIIRIYDLGVDRGHRYITMELLVGEDLWQYSQKRVLSLGQKLELLEQACAGLEEAHQRGVVHRDIKPENLFVTMDGVVKVMDFGLAKGTDRSNTLSRTGMIAGTPEYMSPEQINDFSAVTPASDLYSLGIVAYKLFTGVVPFSNPNLMPLLKMHTDDAPPPLRQHNAFLPAEIEGAVLRLLAKNPADRFPTAAALATELRTLRSKFTIAVDRP